MDIAALASRSRSAQSWVKTTQAKTEGLIDFTWEPVRIGESSMSLARNLLAVTVNPVQAFIREARKSQDMLSGSMLLSHMMLRGLRTLTRECPAAQVVFPQFGTLQTQNDYVRLRVTNEVLAVVPGDLRFASRVAEGVADSALKWWKMVSAKVKNILLASELFEESELALWDEQVSNQFNLAWAVSPLPDDFRGEADAVHALQTLLGAAKRARRLQPYTGDARPKCTLCAQWEQMGPGHERGDWDGGVVGRMEQFWAREFRHRLRALLDRREPIFHELHWAILARIEADGRERLCAVSLVKRLAPVLVLTQKEVIDDFDGFELPAKCPSSPLRFPSTLTVAWIEQKERFVQTARNRPSDFLEPVRRFNLAVRDYAEAGGLPLGRAHLACHEEILAGLGDGDLRDALQDFLLLDGGWLNDVRDRDDSNRLVGRGAAGSDRGGRITRLEAAQFELTRLLTEEERKSVRLDRVPPVALLRADADRLGRRLGEAIGSRGLDGAIGLSRAIGAAMPEAVLRIEGECRGRVVFSGGDELLALIPAAHALRAAEAVARAYEEAGRKNGFPELTASVAVVVVDARHPLRVAVEDLEHLLKTAKEFNRREPLDPRGGSRIDRHAFGLAVRPGSGNVKEGIIGLTLPRSGDSSGSTWRTLEDVLIPLADALRLPDGCGVEVSPRLYRDWLEEFEPGGDTNAVHLPATLLPCLDHRGEPVEGIALAEFRRLAGRHVSVPDAKRFRSACAEPGGPPWLRQWAHALTGLSDLNQFPQSDTQLSHLLINGLTDRIRAILLSGSFRRNVFWESLPWASIGGLLLGVIALATREGR